MSRDFWQTLRAGREVGRLKQSITLPAASYTCFRNLACLEYGVADANNNFSTFGEVINTAFTFECWTKPLTTPASKQTILKFGDATPEFELSITGNTITATVYKGAVATNLTYSGLSLAFNWIHIAVTYNNVTFSLYINGLLMTSVALAGPVDTAANFFHVAQSAALTNLYIGRIAEIRVWNVARAAEDILQYFHQQRNAGLGDVSGLIHYFKCNGVSLISGDEADQINPGSITINASAGKFIEGDWPPLLYGASFIVAETEITLDVPISFQFPVIQPDGCTGQLAVRWIDSDGVVQRRTFWSLAGVDVNPVPAIYNGEPVETPFTLEWWNIDGVDTVDILSDLILYVSDTTTAQNSYDHTNIVAATPSMNTNLGEPYPLVYPLGFDQAQSYS